ncbi:MAG TPA: hypothetical protein DDX14_02330 [Cyanobacteria bacterium UBA9579]|nr:hypothetical protein [Cyanobacteria bacterium UBA9579]
MDKKISNLIIDLENVFADRLVSIILYGSAAFGEFKQQLSDLNLIVVIEQMTASDLQASIPAMNKWAKTKNPLPIFMDKQEMLNSCDVYPIEYSDIKERHKPLFGEDFMDELVIKKGYIRLQCESEIRNILIKLRQGYLRSNNDRKSIDILLKKSSTSIIAIFRAILRMLGETVPQCHKEVVELLSTKVNFDKDVFIDILNLRENNKSFSKVEAADVIQRLINSLKEVLKYVDKVNLSQEEI